MSLLLSLLLAGVVAPPRDVVECVLSLPAKIGPFGGLPLEVRKAALTASDTVIDKKNGFVSFKTDWTDSGWTERYVIQVAVFQRRDKHFIVGVSNSKGQSLGDSSMIGLEFHEFSDGEWSDVTAEVAPPLELKDLWASKKKPPANERGFYFVTYSLPREGTTIAVSLEVWIHKRVDDGGNDVSTNADRQRDAAIESAVSEGKRGVSLVWNSKKGVFTRQ